MEIDWNTIIDIAIKLVVGICVAYVIPQMRLWLQEKIGEEKSAKLASYVTKLVQAAEQSLKEESGAARKEYVMEQLTSLGYEISEDVNAMIESAVFDLKNNK